MLNDSWAGRNPTKGCSADWKRRLYMLQVPPFSVYSMQLPCYQMSMKWRMKPAKLRSLCALLSGTVSCQVHIASVASFVEDWKMYEYWWNDTDREKSTYSEESLFHSHFVHRKSHMDRSEIWISGFIYTYIHRRIYISGNVTLNLIMHSVVLFDRQWSFPKETSQHLAISGYY
jgi:hypothetical protein